MKIIESYISQLRTSFGNIRTPVKEEELRLLYDAKKYEQLVYRMQTILHLDMTTLYLGLVNSGGPRKAAAWIRRPAPMPMYNTNDFKAMISTLYIRKTFLSEASFEQVVLAIAHELCHVLLDSVSHSLRKEERAVDLTAMLLGFRDFYVTGCVTYGQHQADRLGYLTQEEVGFAAVHMTYHN